MPKYPIVTVSFPRVKPFLKWAGGKNWLIVNHPEIFPKVYRRYIEPFLGGGSVFFHLRPKKAILGDANQELIETYEAVQQDWKAVWTKLRMHHRLHCDEYYYQVRRSNPRGSASKAAKFIYLNRTCWNGLYRVNLEGIFNVPKGTKDTVVFPNENFESIAAFLTNAQFIHSDFERLINLAEEGDLVFADPPYTVRHNLNGFVKYNERIFSWDDQIRLAMALKKAKGRGVQIVATNAFHKSVIELYAGDFALKQATRSSVISAKVETRNRYEELVILTEGNI